MNIKLLRKVQKHILAEPRRLNMNRFGELLDEDTLAELGKFAPPCHTQACIGGTACWIERPRIFNRLLKEDEETEIAHRAQKLLGLTSDEADRLFYFAEMRHESPDNFWPAKFQDAYEAAKTPIAKAKIAAKRIDHFIATKGAE